MAVLIPEVQRNNQVPTEQSGEVNVQAPNIVGAGAPQAQGLNYGFHNAEKAYRLYENEMNRQQNAADDVQSTNMWNGIETRAKGRLAEIKSMTGDTSQAYKQLDSDMATWIQQAKEGNEDNPPSDGVLTKFNQKAARGMGRLYESRTVQQATQNAHFVNKTYDAAMSSRQDDMLNASLLLDANNPASFKSLDNVVQDMKQLRMENGQSNGLVYTDDEGNQKINPMLGNQIKEDVGGGLMNVVKALNGAGKANEAKKVLDLYGDYFDAKDKAKLLSDNNDATVQNQALDLVSRLKNQSGVDAINEIDGMKDVGNDIKFKAKEIIDINDRHRENAQKRTADHVMNQMAQDIQTRRDAEDDNPGSAYVSVADFRNRSPLYKQYKDTLSVAQMNTIEKLVNGGPTESDPQAYIDLLDKVHDNSLANMSGSELLEYQSKLSKQDFAPFRNLYMRANLPDTEARKQANITYGTRRLFKQFGEEQTTGGDVLYPKNKKGDYKDSADAALLKDAANEVTNYITDQPHATTKDINDKVAEVMANARAKKEANAAIPWWKQAADRISNMFDGGKNQPSQPSISRTQPAQPQAAPPQSSNATPQSQSTAAQNAGNNSNDMANWGALDWKADWEKNNPGKSLPTATSDMRVVLQQWKNKRLGR